MNGHIVGIDIVQSQNLESHDLKLGVRVIEKGKKLYMCQSFETVFARIGHKKQHFIANTLSLLLKEIKNGACI